MPTHHSTASHARGQLGARVNLSWFVQQQADQTTEEVGFGWIGTPDAPATYPQLRAAFQRSAKTGDPLPVSNQYCDDTVFVEPSDNVAFRYWHDVSHCRLGLSFALPDEWELTLWHLDQLVAAGYPPTTLEFQLLRLARRHHPPLAEQARTPDLQQPRQRHPPKPLLRRRRPLRGGRVPREPRTAHQRSPV